MKGDVLMEMSYKILNLDCAHCGGLIEEALNKIEGIDSAVLIFASKKIKVTGKINDATLKIMNETAQAIEVGVEIVPIEESAESDEKSLASQIVLLAVGAVLFVAALAVGSLTDSEIIPLIIYVGAYLILGHDILSATLKNIRSGRIFDENFLMSAATIGAFILGEYSEAVGVVLFFRIGEIFENYAVERSRKAITAAADLKVNEADVLINGEFMTVSADEIKAGDIVRVKAGERIAVDGVVECGETRLDTSAVNGEPVPVAVRKGDTVISGCINMNDVITVKASAAAGDSMIAKIAEAIENASAGKPKIDRFISRFAKVYTPIVIAISAFTAIIPSIVTGDWSKWVYAALTFLVISCPCALVLSVPLAYFSGIGAASKLGILFKGGSSIEALAKVKAIAFDKTGTLTSGTFSVTETESYGRLSERELLSLCAACEQASAHPVALSIVKYCDETGIAYKSAVNVSELSGRGISAETDGKSLLCGNERLMAENGIEVPENSNDIVGSVVYIAVNRVLEGRIIVSDSIKKTSAQAVKQLKSMGVHTAMLTGDKEENARITANELGIDSAEGGLMPDEKLERIRNIRRNHGAVMFVGDGINDGPVLAGADVGGAMQNGSDLALEASDVVFMNTEPESVVRAKRISDRTLRISYQNIVFALAIKAAVLVFGILGHPSMWFAVFADSGTAMLLILNSIRILNTKRVK